MSAARRRFYMRQPVSVVDVGCGCRRTKLSAFISSLRRPKSRQPSTPHSLSSSSLWASTATTTTTTNSSFSPSSREIPSPPPAQKERETRGNRRSRKARKASPASQSVAVVKESSEPYADFRESMVQMIVEQELYSWDDLNDLLHRFLSLNSPCHHHLIIHAFADLWSVENN